MTAPGDSLATVEPLDLTPRRRFDRLSVIDQLALQAEIREATSNLARLRREFYARNPQWEIA